MSTVDIIEAALQELDAQLFPLTLPETSSIVPFDRLPCVVFKQLGGGGVYSHDDGPAADNPQWEFRCWAQTYAGARRLALSVTGALDTIGMQVTSTVDDREVQTSTPNCVVTASGYFEWEDA